MNEQSTEKRKPCPDCNDTGKHYAPTDNGPDILVECHNPIHEVAEPQHGKIANMAGLEAGQAPSLTTEPVIGKATLGDKLEGSGETFSDQEIAEANMITVEEVRRRRSSGESLGQREATEPLKADEKTDAQILEPSSPAPSSTASPMTPGQACFEAFHPGTKFRWATAPLQERWERAAQAAIDADPVKKKQQQSLAECADLIQRIRLSDFAERLNRGERLELERVESNVRAALEAETKKEKP